MVAEPRPVTPQGPESPGETPSEKATPVEKRQAQADSVQPTPQVTQTANIFGALKRSIDIHIDEQKFRSNQFSESSEPKIEIGSIGWPPPDNLNVGLVGGRTALNDRELKVDLRSPADLSAIPIIGVRKDGGALGNAKEFATISIREDGVGFKWASRPPERAEREALRNCLLLFTSGRQVARIALRTEITVLPLSVKFNDTSVQKIETVETTLSLKEIRRALRIEIPQEAFSRWPHYRLAAKAEGRQVELTTDDEYMPKFKIVLEPKDEQVKMCSTWGWPLDKARNATKKLAELETELAAAEVTFGTANAYYQAKPMDDKLKAEWKDAMHIRDKLKVQRDAAMQCKVLKDATIPYRIVMDVPSDDSTEKEHVVIATSDNFPLQASK